MSNYDGRTLRIVIIGGTRGELAAQIIQNQLMQIGVSTEVVTLDGPAHSAAMMAGEYDMAITDSVSSLIDVSTIWNRLAWRDGHPQPFHEPQMSWLQPRAIEQNVLFGQERIEHMEEFAGYVNYYALQVPLMNTYQVIAFNRDLGGMIMNSSGSWFPQWWYWIE